MKGMYHFALVGQTKSGKTCYLTTLAMRAIGHPGGMTVAWRRDMLGDQESASSTTPQGTQRGGWGASDASASTKPASTGARSSYDDERTARANGTAWIRAAIAAIEKEELPKGNPPERCILEYEIGSADRGATPICLVDYSGESINADMKGPARDGILRHFRACDGLLVVAEAIPDDDPDRGVVETRVRQVVDFFVSLHGDDRQRLSTAIAVVLTKWDTISPVDFDDPASENSDIETFIAARPLYQNLVDAISHMVMEQHDVVEKAGRQVGLRRGNARVFASSSFGHSVQEPDGSRTPLLSERRPFCLIDPLLWLADRADAIAVADLSKASRGPGSWLPWNAWNTLRRARRTMARMPRKSPNRAHVTGFRAVAIGKLVAAAALLFVFGDTAYYANTRRGIESRRTDISSGRGTANQLAASREYGLNVAASPWNGLLPSLIPWLQPDGLGLAAQATDALEKTLGEAVEQANGQESVKAKIEALKSYLDHLPTGKHAGEYASLLSGHIDNERLQKGRERLAVIEAAVQSIDKSDCAARLKDLEQVLAEAVEWPSDMIAHATRIRAQLNARYGELVNGEKDRDLAAKIDEALRMDNYVAAVDALVAHSDKNGDWEQRASDLPASILESSRARTQTLASRLSPQSFTEAVGIGEAAQAALRRGDDLPPRFQKQRDAFRKAIPALNAMLTEVVNKPYDQYLYDQVCTRKSEAACRDYLSTPNTLKSMERAVLRYRRFLEEQATPRSIGVTAHITWGGLKWDGLTPGFDIDQIVTINRKNVINAHVDTNGSVGKTEVFGKPFTLDVLRADEPLDVAITFTEDDWPGEDDDVGKWPGTQKSGVWTPLQMQAGRKIDVDGAALTSPHKIWFTVDRNPYPSEPSLPPWSQSP